MRPSSLYLLASAYSLTEAINIVQSNDDGWAEINIRALFNSLIQSGHKSIISGPAENKSGSSSLDLPALPRLTPCQFDSCPALSPAQGSNSSDPRLNYVNSFPVTAIKYGLNTLAPQLLNGQVDLAVTGPNVGSNLGIVNQFSGTVGAADAAVQAGIPAIAFSGATGDPTAWNASTPVYAQIYADLATNVTNTLVASGAPYLPDGTFLNVNFPDVDTTTCASTGQFKFVLSRVLDYVPLISGPDVDTCGNGGKLPTESAVIGTDGCYASISVAKQGTKTDADANAQGVVLNKLASILTCLPN